MLVTSGSISRTAWKLLKASGVLAMDGSMLAAFLADRRIAVDSGIFSDAAFNNWIDRSANN
jgi:hypothetical protein